MHRPCMMVRASLSSCRGNAGVVLVCVLPAYIDWWSAHTGSLEESERDILNLRSQQGRFEERVAMMQGLLQVSILQHWMKRRCAMSLYTRQYLGSISACCSSTGTVIIVH